MEEQKKNYSEMSIEELESELRFAEMEASLDKKLLNRTEFFASEYTSRKAEYDASVGEVNEIKSEIFGRNQKETLSRLNDTSKAALEEYYQFHTEGLGTAKTVMTFFGIYDGNARKMDSDNLKENAMTALEAQGIPREQFRSIYEYYKFQRDAERTAANTAELAETYENSGALGKTAMNVGTVLNAPVRGLAASTEALASLGYEDKYAPLNINSPAYDMVNFTDTVRSETVQDIDSGAGKFVYQTGMSVADFGATLPLTALPGGQAAALASMGMNAGSSAAKDATLRGVSKEQALATGLTSGAVEVVTEKLPLDSLADITKAGGKTTVNIAKQAGIEGTEEMIAEVGNTAADNYINGVNSNYNLNLQSYINAGMTQEAATQSANLDFAKEVGLAGLSGTMSGGITGSTAQAINGMTISNTNVSQTVEQVESISQEHNKMAEYADLSNEEVYDVLFEKIDNSEMVSVQDLRDIVATRSVVDPKAGENAVTVFYSGESEELINELSARADDKVRVIRRTEAFQFLADKRFQPLLNDVIALNNPSWNDDMVKAEVINLLYESSETESEILKEGEGFWTVISRRFAAETKGDAYSLCTNAAENRIFSRDELRTWLANAPQDAKMAGITKDDLLAMSQGKEQFEAVKAKTIEDMQDTTLYFNERGIKVGQTFQGTSLEEYVEDIIPEESAYTVTMNKYVRFLSDDQMEEKVGESYTALSRLEKLQARAQEYLVRTSAAVDLVKPVEKLKLYKGVDGEIHNGIKPVLIKGANGGFRLEAGVVKNALPSAEKTGIKEFVK